MNIKESQTLMDNWLEWKFKNNIDLLRLEDMQDMIKLNVIIFFYVYQVFKYLGKTYEGRPVALYQAANVKPSEIDQK